MIGWNAGGKSEQLVLQEQRRASGGAIQQARPVTGPLKVVRKKKKFINSYNEHNFAFVWYLQLN